MTRAGGVRDVPGGSIPPVGGDGTLGTGEGTGGQDSTRGQLTPILDPGSPYADLKPQDGGNGYVKVQMTGHPIARKDGRVLLHRLVHFEATQGEDQTCALCGLDGLNWFAPPTDKTHHLTVDHKNSNKLDDRQSNLRSAHKWCNENRHAVDQLKIPWSFVATIPVLDRKPCWNHVLGCVTPNAYAYQRRAEGARELAEVDAATSPKAGSDTGELTELNPVSDPSTPSLPPIRRGLVRWEDLVG